LITLEDQIKCIKREIALRRNVYAKRVAAGAMKESMADREMELIQAVCRTLESHQQKEQQARAALREIIKALDTTSDPDSAAGHARGVAHEALRLLEGK
jgi:hypothetical protein